MQVVGLDEDVRIEEVGHLLHAQSTRQLVESLRLLEAPHLKGIATWRLPLQRAGDQRACEVLACSNRLGIVEVAAS